jgi:hypothetical protein
MTTIYLARIIKLNDYSGDTTIELEAFDALEKAVAFLTDKGMVELSCCWVSPTDGDIEGTIETLVVK